MVISEPASDLTNPVPSSGTPSGTVVGCSLSIQTLNALSPPFAAITMFPVPTGMPSITTCWVFTSSTTSSPLIATVTPDAGRVIASTSVPVGSSGRDG
jgi:hypothetical protein